jgi:urease accessory protein UreH
VLSDRYNLKNHIYDKREGNTIHHIDFHKLNNNPDNLKRMEKMDHFMYHQRCLEYTLHRPDIKEKSKLAHKTEEYRNKIRELMSTPKMKALLSSNAKKQ